MPVQLDEIPSTRFDRIEHTGLPVAGPAPAATLTTASREIGGVESAAADVPAAPRRTERALLLAGRAIFGGYFAYNGVNHLMNADSLSQYASSKEVPLAKAAVIGSGAMLLLGGISLLTGYRPKIGASLIAGFLFGVTPRMHDFWNAKDEQQRMNDLIHFSKNVAMVGGACYAAAAEA